MSQRQSEFKNCSVGDWVPYEHFPSEESVIYGYQRSLSDFANDFGMSDDAVCVAPATECVYAKEQLGCVTIWRCIKIGPYSESQI